MKLPLTGSCQCGKLRYEITEAPQLVYTCHCTDCQRITGSAFSLGIAVPEGGFRLTAGEPRPLRRMADSGRLNTRFVCPDCGLLALQSAARWRHPRPGRNARRQIMAAADQAHLDAQQTALGQLCRG